ncbi:hypothetical protein LXL04_034969 [Taraxacum kok-saghyz]
MPLPDSATCKNSKWNSKKSGNPFGYACDEKHFKIKCKDQSSYDCTHTKRTSHFKKFSETKTFKPRPGFQQRNTRDKKKWKFVRKNKEGGWGGHTNTLNRTIRIKETLIEKAFLEKPHIRKLEDKIKTNKHIFRHSIASKEPVPYNTSGKKSDVDWNTDFIYYKSLPICSIKRLVMGFPKPDREDIWINHRD